MNRNFYSTIRSTQVMIVALLCLAIQGCAGMNPVAQAETTEQRAFALYGSFVIFKERAADLVSSGQLPNDAVIAIGRANRPATEVADSLLEAALEFKQIQQEYQEGGEDAETRYIAAMNNLNAWITQAAPAINRLIAAVQEATQ